MSFYRKSSRRFVWIFKPYCQIFVSGEENEYKDAFLIKTEVFQDLKFFLQQLVRQHVHSVSAKVIYFRFTCDEG